VQIASTAGPLDVDLIGRYRLPDFSASGQIVMWWGSSIRTNGGDVLLSGERIHAIRCTAARTRRRASASR